MSISIAIITKNEAHNLRDCLNSVKWADEIVLVDSGSTDQTVSIAEEFGARVYDIPFTNFSNQKNEALSRCRSDWIFLIDADERVTPELAREIQTLSNNVENAVYAVGRRTYFFNKPMRYGGTQNDWNIRLFPKGKAHYVQPVHETIETPLPVKKLSGVLAHYSTRDLTHYRQKVEKYIPFEIEILRKKNRTPRVWDIFLKPIGTFLNLYAVQAGLLDGFTGLQYAVLSSYYSFRKYRTFYFTAKA